MKRTELLRQMDRAARAAGLQFHLIRSTGDHDVYSLEGLRIGVPRHRDIAEGTADGIRRRAEEKLGKRWWT